MGDIKVTITNELHGFLINGPQEEQVYSTGDVFLRNISDVY
jgi:hypothetical protein